MTKRTSLIMIAALLCCGYTTAQNVAINETGETADPSAILDIQSTSKGILVPSLTTLQRQSVASPANGLLVFDNTTVTFWFCMNGEWTELVAAAKGLRDTDSDTRIEVEAAPDEDVIRFTIAGKQIARLDSSTFHLSAPGGSVFIGKDAGIHDDATNNFNVFIGHQSGSTNTGGYNNTGLGYQSLLSNNTGFNNTAIGALVLTRNTTGGWNTGLGQTALYWNTTGTANCGVGVGALFNNTDGFQNTATGTGSLIENTSGFDNTALGYIAMSSNLSGSGNTAVGAQALYQNSTASYNTAAGHLAMYSNITGGSNVAIGVRALFSNTNRSNLVAVGDSALYHNGTDAIDDLDAWGNTAIGSKALYANTTGFLNTAIGLIALRDNKTGYLNTATGYGAMHKHSNGDLNTAYGSWALSSDTTGMYNTSIGGWTLQSNADGIGNTVVGTLAGSEMVYGDHNTFIGYESGLGPGLNKAIAIGYQSTVECDNCMALGGLLANAVKVGLNTTVPAASLHVKQLFATRPWRMEFDSDSDYWEADIDIADDWNFYYNNALKAYITNEDGSYIKVSDRRLKENIQPYNTILPAFVSLKPVSYRMKDCPAAKMRSIGLIAQEVEAVFPEAVHDKEGIKGVDYMAISVLAIQAIRELAEESKILRKRMDEMEKMIND